MGSVTMIMRMEGVLLFLMMTGLVVGQSGECQEDTDCTEDHICQDTNCVKKGVFCNIEKHCNASLVGTACLDSGLCGCGTTEDCLPGSEGSDEICVAIEGFCRTDQDCEDEDFECVNTVCTRKPGSCGAREDCVGNSVGYNCVGGRCGCGNANADCPAGNLCRKAKCILKGVFCSVRGDCVQSSKGLGCYDGKCGCKGSADCERGGVCKDGRCRSKPSQACENNDQCQFAQDGNVCTRGTCGCFNDNDCSNAGSLCNQGRCSQGFGGPGGPPPELLGLGGPGGPPPGGPGNNPFGK